MTLSKLLLLALVAFVFGIAVGILLIFVLVAINEEPRKRCGNCIAFDRDLRICWWDRMPRDDYKKGCARHERKTVSDETQD